MSNHDVSSRLREVLKSDKKVTLGAMVDKVSAQKEIKQNVEMKNDVSSKKESGDDLREKELSILKEQYANEFKKVVELEKARLKDIYEKKIQLLEGQFKSKIDSLTSCIAEFRKKTESLNSSLELIAIKTIEEILKKMTIDLAKHEEFIADIIKKALLDYNREEGLTLKVNIHDYEMIKKIISENNLLANYNIVIEKDNSLISGQYLIDLKESMLDIGVVQQFDKVRQLLNE
ncbi:TPA: hypothetical protein PKT66_003242 [Acinetobacter baumannii]|nr:hypothetical protein [Acinetobacter baumannii]HDI2821236.1 hypothetical protein [Acinetobacter baumannii]